MCLITIPGWRMELRLGFIRVTSTIRGLVDHISHSAGALESGDSGAGLVGVGIRGAAIGEATVLFSITIIMSLTAGLSSIGSPVVQVGISAEAWTDLPSEGTAGSETVAIVAELYQAATLPFLPVFTIAIRPSLRVFAIAILRSLREPFRTVATFVVSASRVPTPVLVLALSMDLVRVEPNMALPLGDMTVWAPAEALVADEVSGAEAALAVAAGCTEAAEAADDGTNKGKRD